MTTEPLPALIALVVDEQGQWMLRVADPEDRLIVVVVSDHLPEPERKFLWRKRESLEQLTSYLGPMEKPKPVRPKPRLVIHQGGKT